MKYRNALFLILLALLITGCLGRETVEPVPTINPTLPPIPTNTATAEIIPAAFTSTATTTSTSTPPAQSTPTSPATTAPCQRPNGWVDYTIQPGNTLSILARRTGSTVQEIKTINCLTSDIIYVNQTLFLPQQPAASVPATTAVIAATNTPTADLPPPITGTPTPTETQTATDTPTPTSTTEIIPPGGPGDPRLLITPYSGPIGTSYTVTLENYDPNDTVTIEIFFTGSGQVVFTSTTFVNEMGNGTFQFYTEPGDEPGLYILKATGSDGSPNLSGEFQIDP